ncbi:MAG TPA: beta-galactosidase, partial [Kiritimatiellia bacterium]
LAHRIDHDKLIRHLQRIKDLGFNTLNLYGDQMIPEMLAWCDEHELAVYFRTAFNNVPGLNNEQREFPDLMDPSFREKAKKTYANFLPQVKNHPSVLALDVDNRWLFPLDWTGATRSPDPKLGPESVNYIPRWLEKEYGGDIAKLNAAWQTQYKAFDDVLHDRRIVRDGRVQFLADNPWRVDLIRYTVWTQADFFRELAAFLQAEAGGYIVTPTTEHPEVLPDTNPKPSDGIAFMSPVHYNQDYDYDRDTPSLAKLIYETRWHYDIQGGPTYISETGWRTDTLEQNPPVRNYAWMEPPDEELAARCYAAQFSLLQVLPWVSGYGYFKMYDKVPEGDFGYLRDDGGKKPQSFVGDAINGAFNVPDLADPDPQAWIYYPEYAQATHKPGYQQLKTFVSVWEKDFLASLYARIDQYWTGLRAGDRAVGAAFAADVLADFKAKWRGFAFATKLPDDDRPVILLSTVSEILTPADRAALLGKKTICFGPVGVRDIAMDETELWNAAALNVDGGSGVEGRVGVDLKNGREAKAKSFWSWLPWYKAPEFS